MLNNDSKERILKRLRMAPEQGWVFDEKLINDNWNGFEEPESLINSFLSRLEAVKGEGFVVDGKEGFAVKLMEFIRKNGWTEIYCSMPELSEYLKNAGVDIVDESVTGRYEVAITGCENLIALTGSVMVSSVSGSGRRIHVSPDNHIVYAGLSQLRPFIRDGFKAVLDKSEPSWIGLITGPSRTADIEKTLVLGAHGPKRFIVFVDQNL